MFPFIKLIRYQNLLMLAFMQLVFRYGFFKFQNIPLALNDWQYTLLVLSTVLLAAGGYVINNIFDQDTDTINKPANVIVGKSISETKAYNIYVALNCAGVGIGFYLSNVIQKPGFASIFILIAATLYFYATSLKQMILIGNTVIALLLAFSVIIVGIFDLYPATYEGNQQQMAVIFSILLDYALFTFILNFIREIVKDLEDVHGDFSQGMNTLPIAIGINRTSKIIFGLSFIPILAILFYINNYLFQLQFATLYLMLSVLGPLLYFTFKIWNAKTKNEFQKLSLLLKWILLFGIVSIVVITLNMHYNA
ncbi:geranylgeranylglycerol-phosphate geranylgeranyltransferase [Flavobacterium sp. 83]|uniref:geranylgeranylglycerol-phosphate geranylgeranyltransferase n=1 Tax=Flavobacterium sp. 83 TaxID=1131812 RepID=UPI0009DF4D89|nr:geranylgeranylglycerol-phosphate geranylgeranyltransferase [Flavobacterium sp. 83]